MSAVLSCRSRHYKISTFCFGHCGNDTCAVSSHQNWLSITSAILSTSRWIGRITHLRKTRCQCSIHRGTNTIVSSLQDCPLNQQFWLPGRRSRWAVDVHNTRCQQFSHHCSYSSVNIFILTHVGASWCLTERYQWFRHNDDCTSAANSQ